ncbi:MAG: D-tyrosyl-tRNA(Tyr) deacylase [Tatlockia sp.]|nr:D-tyrosyl-tRNA(Tyr) deacylase [Tatlockia sp.]
MRSLIQLVTHAEVRVDEKIIGAIETGILALIGIEKTDTEKEVEKLFNKIINYRIFPDSEGKTNLSLKDIQGELLLVPQFTLVAETSKGMRPGFSTGMNPQEGKRMFEYFVNYANNHYASIASGSFGAYMQVSLCNDGPMTFMLQV